MTNGIVGMQDTRKKNIFRNMPPMLTEALRGKEERDKEIQRMNGTRIRIKRKRKKEKIKRW